MHYTTAAYVALLVATTVYAWWYHGVEPTAIRRTLVIFAVIGGVVMVLLAALILLLSNPALSGWEMLRHIAQLFAVAGVPMGTQQFVRWLGRRERGQTWPTNRRAHR